MNNLDILLINPPYERLKKLGSNFVSVAHGVLGLASYLEENGVRALAYDAEVNDSNAGTMNNKSRAENQKNYAEAIDDSTNPVWDEVRETIKALNPKVVGVSMMTPTLHAALRIVRIAKEMGYPVIIGGPHVNVVKDRIFAFDEVDYVVFGEGEIALNEFMDIYLSDAPDKEAQFKAVKGLWKKDWFEGTEKCKSGLFAQRIKSLDSLPIPNRRLLVYLERYGHDGLNNLIASRGCPYKCDFCASVPLWGLKTTYRSPEHVFKEIVDLRENYGVREFRFFDDIFTAKRSNVIEFCKLMVKNYGKNYFAWWCLSRINTIDEEMLYWLKAAGCYQIHLGIESGSPRVLKQMNKNITPERVKKACDMVKNHGFWLHAFFMFGLPYETEEDMQETVKFINYIDPDSVNLCTFTPYPGTDLYTYCIEKGLLKEDPKFEIFKHIGHHSTFNFFSHAVTREQYDKNLKIVLDLTSKISSRTTMRKLKIRAKQMNVEKILRKGREVIRNRSLFGQPMADGVN